jgi:hypothetical protein
MNNVYLISLLGTLSVVGAACYWARMNGWRTTYHLIAAPVAIPAIGFTVYLGIAMPLALISLGLDSLFAVNIDAALESTARLTSGIIVVGMIVGYFRTEKSYLSATRIPQALRSNSTRLKKGLVPVCRKRKPIGEEYREIRAKRFATGTIYILPKTIPHSNRTGSRATPVPVPNKLGPLYATVRPKQSTPDPKDSRFTWRSIEA